MDRPDKSVRERLLKMETLNGAQRQTYGNQIKAMLDGRLDPIKRIGFGLLALIALLSVIGFGGPASREDESWEEVFVFRLLMIVAVLVSMAWTALTGWTALSGVCRRSHRPWIAAMALAMVFFYIVALMFIFALPISQEESRALVGTQWVLVGFFFLNTVGLCATLAVLYRGQFKSQEKLLEIEYRLADRAEQIGGRAKP
ncbi:MAG: hypothetical protein JSW27_19390 [Phycisphaerales bacterium]|nr:MAG: hypothetical protein JSW27_19390 [Phycisphaerales bacterium]